MKYLISSLAFFLFYQNIASQTYSKETILITTSCGNIKIKLYNETPLHRDNFLKLVKQGTYNDLLFHRVINQFMIQGGDPDSKTAKDSAALGEGDVGYWIPAEFNQKLYHKKGALGAAREDDELDPAKESSGCQFYIVTGKTFDEAAIKKAEIRVNKNIVQKINVITASSGKSPELRKYYLRLSTEGKTDSLKYARTHLIDPVSIKEYENTPHFTFTTEQKKTYATVGGAPHLDMNYTVFGQVVEGLDVIDKIAGVKTDKNDRPKENIRMKVSIIKE